jgi:hypothetical protein
VPGRLHLHRGGSYGSCVRAACAYMRIEVSGVSDGPVKKILSAGSCVRIGHWILRRKFWHAVRAAA